MMNQAKALPKVWMRTGLAPLERFVHPLSSHEQVTNASPWRRHAHPPPCSLSHRLRLDVDCFYTLIFCLDIVYTPCVLDIYILGLVPKATQFPLIYLFCMYCTQL